MVQVWWAHASDARPELADNLTLVEVTRMRRYRRVDDQNRCLVAWSLIRIVLGEMLGRPPRDVPISRQCRRCGSDAGHGKPFVSVPVSAGSPPIEFSLSHSGNLVVMAVGVDGPVGVDVEEVRPVEGVGSMVFSDHEQPVEGKGLIRVWVRKEAVIKATGEGLLLPMTSLTVSGPEEPAALLASETHNYLPRVLQLTDLPADDGYLASLAVIGPASPVVVHSSPL